MAHVLVVIARLNNFFLAATAPSFILRGTAGWAVTTAVCMAILAVTARLNNFFLAATALSFILRGTAAWAVTIAIFITII
ncbi:hypothetical protein BOX15_Mlig027597g39 [Macrostomum lignano]|uniref:Uncharacterized protein n=1 Tax=Macrostomum lignano TaxID=282301 RepID=A0A267FUJ3_9PLAT|nr:hypothetical protein BOX15_Mlig027597g39 [Macrostomum lignano]